MYTAIKGIYEDGVLRLLEPAPHVGRAEVLITFLNEPQKPAPGSRQPGGLRRIPGFENKHLSIPDNFNDPIDDLKDYM